VTLANPFGPPVLGWEQAAATLERAASFYRDGEAMSFETIATRVTPELAYLVELERYSAKIGGGADVTPVALRVTSMPSRPAPVADGSRPFGRDAMAQWTSGTSVWWRTQPPRIRDRVKAAKTWLQPIRTRPARERGQVSGARPEHSWAGPPASRATGSGKLENGAGWNRG
jgi:hypothetical protein